MKLKTLRKKLLLTAGLSVVVLFGVIAYAASSTILGVGLNANSGIIGGPATMTARKLTNPGR